MPADVDRTCRCLVDGSCAKTSFGSFSVPRLVTVMMVIFLCVVEARGILAHLLHMREGVKFPDGL